MSKNGDFFLGMWTGWMLFFVLMVIGSGLWGKPGYQEGQIDAIQGKIQYELKRQTDGTTKWEKINED